jgi:RimJ/RimL family protein N-acetyltransferase
MPPTTTPQLTIRSVTPADRALLADLFERLSPQSRYLRFHTPTPRLDERALARIVETDGRDHVTLAAVDPRDGTFAGVAQYAPAGDGSSDVAFAVADAWQRRGVGTALALALLGHAAQQRRSRLVAVTLGENRAARALLRRIGFRITGRGGGQVDHELQLGAPAALAA